MSGEEKKRVLVIFPLCELLEKDSSEFFKKFTKELKAIEESYLQMAYSVEVCWSGLSCKWPKEQKLLKENVHSFYSKIVKFGSWKNFKSSFFFMRDCVSDRQALWYASEALKRREETYDFVAAITDSRVPIDKRAWIYKSVKHSLEEEGNQHTSEEGAEVMTWSFFCKMNKKGNSLFKEEEIFKPSKPLVIYTFSDSIQSLPDVSVACAYADFVCFSTKDSQNLAKNGWASIKLDSFQKNSKRLLTVCKACHEAIIEKGASASIWIEPELAAKLNPKMLEDLSKRTLMKQWILLESTEQVLHKSFKFKDLIKNFTTKLLWSKLKDKMNCFDSSVVIRPFSLESKLLGSRVLSLSSEETLSKDGFDLVLSKAMNDCKLEDVNVCKSEDFKKVYFKK